jgi:hypothetical protein
MNVYAEFKRYKDDKKTAFNWFHDFGRLEKINEKLFNLMGFSPNLFPLYEYNKHNEKLDNFLDARLDEVRLRNANEWSLYALMISDNRDLSYFREAVTRREISGEIDYNRQRDHAAHTLNNYLLGFYIFDKSEAFFSAFHDFVCNKLELSLGLTNAEEQFYRVEIDHTQLELFSKAGVDIIPLTNYFAEVWQYSSLLHDIGYILEGIIDSSSFQTENLRITNGAKIIHDYFSHFLWRDFNLDFRTAKSVFSVYDVMVPDFKSTSSLSSLADYLCDPGSCESIRKKFSPELGKTFAQDYSLNLDSLSLLEGFYKTFKIPYHSKIIELVNKTFKKHLWEGTDLGFRTLNHGVCSGLIELLSLTFFYEIYSVLNGKDYQSFKRHILNNKFFHIYNSISSDEFISFRDQITKFTTPAHLHIRGAYKADIWYKIVVWASAATSIHDIVQDKDWINIYRKEYHITDNNNSEHKLDYKADPIAFLGVLVDILQEWDRYSLIGNSAFIGIQPLQGTDIELNYKDGVVEIFYPKKREYESKSFESKLEAALDGCLLNWREIIHLKTKL